MGLSTEQLNKLSGGNTSLMVAADLAALNAYKTVYTLKLNRPLTLVHTAGDDVTISGEANVCEVNTSTIAGATILEIKFDRLHAAGRSQFNIDPDAIISFAVNPEGNVKISEVISVVETGYTAKYENSFGIRVATSVATSGDLVFMAGGKWNTVVAITDWTA